MVEDRVTGRRGIDRQNSWSRIIKAERRGGTKTEQFGINLPGLVEVIFMREMRIQ